MKTLIEHRSATTWLIAVVTALQALGGADARAYTPPTGIPMPVFGIEQKHTDYAGRQFAAGGFPYRDAGNGPYSHYVDSQSAACTDQNAYGTAAVPRCTIPSALPAGSVVELHGGPYDSLNLSGVAGSLESPIYIRGANESSKVSLTGQRAVTITNSSYIIIENIVTDGSQLTGASRSYGVTISSPSSHIAIRTSEARGYPMPDFCADLNRACWNNAIWSVGAGVDGATGNRASNVVFYRNYIHDNADYPPAYESGRHGIMSNSGSEDVWVLENTIERSGDDGVQVYWTASGNYGPPASRVYIGGNVVHHMGENAFDIKQSYDVIISENDVWGYRQTQQIGAGSDGSAIVLNNDEPSDRLWVLYNRIHDSNIGIRTQSHGDVHILGNVIYDIVRDASAVVPISSTGSTSGVAITAKSSNHLYVLNNTIDHADGGVYVVAGLNPFYVDSNIITNLNETTSFAVAYSTGTLEIRNNLLHSANGNTALKKASCLSCVVGSDPLYEDVVLKDYRLRDVSGSRSPAIDRGILDAIYDAFKQRYGLDISVDKIGVRRPSGNAWDIGAYESAPTSTMGAPRNLRNQ